MNAAAWNDIGRALPTPQEMAAWDAASCNEFHIPDAMLMENASREATNVFAALLKPRSRVLVIMGGGNNGGDGACIARHLHDQGHQVLVCHANPLDKLSFTAKEHVFIARKTGVPFICFSLDGDVLASPPEYRAIANAPHLVVDALLGTGFSGQLREKELTIIRRINRFAETTPVVAVDIPSGLDGLTGHPKPEAVRAVCTVTFEAAKPGLVFHHAREYTGDLHVRRIGIPAAVRTHLPASFYLLAPESRAWPVHCKEMHKGSAGRVLIFGGSRGLTGAPVLAALGALRAGAGLAVVACPGKLEPELRQGFPEIMTRPLGNGEIWNVSLLPDCVAAVADLPRAAALVLGPGLGRKESARDVVAAILEDKRRPSLVLDADGLFALGEGSGGDAAALLRLLREDDCITPHPGEAARLLGTDSRDIQAARVSALRALMEATPATVVLKGSNTLIGRRNAPVFIAPFATPSLAVGGAGDVLSGIIAALLATMRVLTPFSGFDAFRAVCLATHLHGKAGEDLDARYPERGALARDIADAVTRVRRA